MTQDPVDAVAPRQRGESGLLELADGGHTTTSALDELGPGWAVLHDVAWPGRPQVGIDHVVIGPAGAFVIATETWTGAVRLESGVLQQNGRPRIEATAGVTEAAYAVAKLLGTAVTPVLVLAGRRVAGRAGEVVVCSPHGLVPMLESRLHLLDRELASFLEAEARVRLAPPSAQNAPAERRALFRFGGRRGSSTA